MTLHSITLKYMTLHLITLHSFNPPVHFPLLTTVTPACSLSGLLRTVETDDMVHGYGETYGQERGYTTALAPSLQEPCPPSCCLVCDLDSWNRVHDLTSRLLWACRGPWLPECHQLPFQFRARPA